MGGGPLFFGRSTSASAVLENFAKVAQLIEEIVTSEGLELVHCEVAGSKHAPLLRIYIDKPGGVTHADCENISNHVGTVLDVEDLIPRRYILEVSSPGLDRGLYKKADYQRFTGRLAKIRTAEPVNGQRNFKGRLKGLASESGIEQVILVDDRGNEFRLPLEKIQKANLEIEF